jgi:hypothetical protein
MTAVKVGHEYTAYFLFTILYILLCKLRIGVAITFWTCIRQELGSDLGRHTAYLDRSVRGYLQSFLANTGILSRYATTASFQILSSFFINNPTIGRCMVWVLTTS